MRRKSDFFHGDWEKALLEVFKKEAEIAMKDKGAKSQSKANAKPVVQKKEDPNRLARQKEINNQKICDITEEEAIEILKEEEEK